MRLPTIDCVFHNSEPLGFGTETLVKALQAFVNDHFAPVWGLGCVLQIAAAPGPHNWALVFADDSDQAGALGYHNDPPGAAPPDGFVFVRNSKKAGVPVSVTASHELAELLADPGCNLGAFSPRGRWLALEPCDPVQAETFTVNGLPVSDFVTPAWFGAPGDVYDKLGHVRQPFQLLPGGYIPVWANGRWTQLFADQEAQARHADLQNPHRRTERRRRTCLRPWPTEAHGALGSGRGTGAMAGAG